MASGTKSVSKTFCFTGTSMPERHPSRAERQNAPGGQIQITGEFICRLHGIKIPVDFPGQRSPAILRMSFIYWDAKIVDHAATFPSRAKPERRRSNALTPVASMETRHQAAVR